MIVSVAVLPGADFAGPPLPKDTLPARLNFDKPPPLGLDQKLPVPADNPLTDAKVDLGRKLFFDPLLSADRSVACASCHIPERAFADGRPVAIGIHGQKGRRNAPSLVNRVYGASFFWDGREASLEAQALRPIEDPLELGTKVDEVIARLKADATYAKLFAAAFPDGVTAANLGRALASFQRALLVGDSRVDRFRAAQSVGFSEAERQGLWLFESKGRCWRCHSGNNLSDEQFHNTGVSWGKEPLDLGRFEVTKREEDRGRFKTPTLRGVALTAPYMHDGSLATLEDVIEFYNKGGVSNPHLDPIMTPLKLSKEDVQHLVAFLRAFTPETSFGSEPVTPNR
jgi:cytochrome c peroxidase